MRLRTIVAVGLAALFATTGTVAALPGYAPADAGPGDTTAVDGDAGPPAALPGPVPDVVSDIQEAIQRFLAGDLGRSLGATVNGIATGTGR